MTSIELVRMAAKCRGIDPNSKSAPAALARELGYAAYNAPQKVKRWLKGENEPDYSATLELLELAGLLRTESGPVFVPVPGIGRPRELEDEVEQLHQARGQIEAEVAALRTLRAQIEEERELLRQARELLGQSIEQ